MFAGSKPRDDTERVSGVSIHPIQDDLLRARICTEIRYGQDAQLENDEVRSLLGAARNSLWQSTGSAHMIRQAFNIYQ